MATKKATKTAKSTPKRAATKRSAPKKTSKKSSVSSVRSYVSLRPENEPFMTFRVNRQTVYWLVLGAIVILFTSWLMKLQMDIQALYDQIDATSIQM